MMPHELAAIREKHEAGWPLSREAITALLDEVDRLTRDRDLWKDAAAVCASDAERDLRDQAKDFRAEIADLQREHAREMNEAGAELRAMERDRDRSEEMAWKSIHIYGEETL